MKTKRFPRLHDDDELPLRKKKAPFYWNRWDSNPRTTSSCIRGDPKALPTELRLRHTFFQQILFNHYIDDTDDNRVDTIWLLGLQSIVEGVDRLDGHY